MLTISIAVLLLAATPDAGAGVAAPDITTGLPWQFDQPDAARSRPPKYVRMRERDPFSGAAETLSWSWTSKKPYAKDGSHVLFLHMYLTRFDYGNDAAATRALAGFVERADPEMGFSYAWDYVVADGHYLWHLGAPCLWSRANFDRLVSNLMRDVVAGHNTGAGTSVYCECGGRCRRR